MGKRNYVFCAAVAATIGVCTKQIYGQPAIPPAGYFDIPPGFDFPANKRLLEQYRRQPNLAAQRLHAWNVFSGITSPTPDGKHAIFQTWFSEEETFANRALALAARPAMVQFKVPSQFHPLRPQINVEVEAAGTAVLSSVLYNLPAYNHVRSNRLYLRTVLDDLAKTGTPDTKIPQNRSIPPFPVAAVVLKTVWWPVAKDKISGMPIWDPDRNPPLARGNPITTWARYVGVDPIRKSTVPSGEIADIVYDGQTKHGSHIVGLNNFHYVTLTQSDVVDAVNKDTQLARVAQASFGRPLAVGDYAVLVATHLTTKEIDDWVWATFWWHDKPTEGPFALDRVGSIYGIWRNFLMSVSYDLNLPSDKDGGPHVAFNPWLEARFEDRGHGGGVVSNCMNCHNRASTRAEALLPIYRGNPDFLGDSAYKAGALRTDFLWSILINAQ
jgi:hypothetical protein